MRLRIVSKSSLVEQNIDKQIRLHIIEKKDSDKKILNEGGIANTLARNLYDYVKEYIINNDVDPNNIIEINVRPEIERFIARSKKFDVPLDKFVVFPPEMKRKNYADYDVATKAITIKMPIGIDPKEYSIYKKPAESKKNISEEDFDKKIKEFLKKNQVKLSFFPNISNVKYTSSQDINKSILDDIKAKNFMALDMALSPGGKYRQETVASTDSKKIFIPGSRERRAAVTDAFSRIKPLFLTKVHEATHALQYKGGADSSSRISQLNNIIGKEVYMSELLPKLQFRSYSKIPITDFKPEQGDDFGNFFYFSRPIEVNARIAAFREVFKTLKKVDYQSAPAKLFEKISREEEEHKARMRGQDNLATEELQNKFMYQFYYILSKDAPDIFRTDPRYQEKLNEYKLKVDSINKEIDKLTDERTGTRSAATDNLKQQYLTYLIK